jgi:hypothetical protein
MRLDVGALAPLWVALHLARILGYSPNCLEKLSGKSLAATAARIPALEDRFEVMEEAHQPFQEVPDEWNARVDAFWREVEARG